MRRSSTWRRPPRLHVLAADPTLPVSAPLAARGADVAAGPSAYRGRALDAAGAEHLVRASTFMPGVASIDPLKLDGEALSDYGVTVARLGRALRSFFHPSAGRTLLWDVQHASSLRPMTDAIEDRDHRALIDGVLDRFETDVVPRWWSLRSQVIHGDVTLDNALMDDRGRISGIIDFGDMSHSALVCDLSAALESSAARAAARRCRAARDALHRRVSVGHAARARGTGGAARPPLDAARDRRGVVRMARASSPRQRVSAWVGGTLVAVARVPRDGAGGELLRGAASGRRAGRGRAGVDRTATVGLRPGAVPAHVRPSAAPRARGGRVAGGRRRRAVLGLLQQRAGRRSLPSARHRRDRAPVAAAQYEHALSARCRDRAGRTVARDDAPGLGARHGALRELRERGQRHGLAARDHLDRRRRWARELVRLSRRDAGDHRRVARGMARRVSSRARRGLRRARSVSRRHRPPRRRPRTCCRRPSVCRNGGSCRRSRSSTAGSPPTGSRRRLPPTPVRSRS